MPFALLNSFNMCVTQQVAGPWRTKEHRGSSVTLLVSAGSVRQVVVVAVILTAQARRHHATVHSRRRNTDHSHVEASR